MNNKNVKLQEKINIDELAELSHIALSGDEKQRMEREICEFVEFAKCLDGYAPIDDAVGGITFASLRDDVAAPSEYAQSITGASGNFENGLFVLPKVVKEEQK